MLHDNNKGLDRGVVELYERFMADLEGATSREDSYYAYGRVMGLIESLGQVCGVADMEVKAMSLHDKVYMRLVEEEMARNRGGVEEMQT